jgi:lipoate-protein ligase A
MADDSVNWIRRSTGGRAVLHWGDLTYSCIFPKAFSFMGTTVKESYAIITRCLIDGLNLAGIECTTHDSYDQLLAVKRDVKLPCFLAPNRDEIMVKNRKLVGSAQKRVAESILQHGSIPITSDYSRLPDYLLIDQSERDTQKNLLLAKSIYLHELNPQITAEMLLIYLRKGFSNVLKLNSTITDWTEQELYDIRKIALSDEFLKTWVE